MLVVILATLTLWVLGSFIPGTIRYLRSDLSNGERLSSALGSRDVMPELTPHGERAARAANNLSEALPVFLTLALLCEIGGPAEVAITGAWVWLALRVLYLPAYILGVPGLRSLLWMLSWIGLGLMASSLL